MVRRAKKRVSLKDVAKAIGVNASTVSRALDPASTHPLSDELKERIRKASQKLGYKPNIAAYSLRTNLSKTVGVVVPDITDPVFPPILRGIEAALEKSGYVSIIANTENDKRRESRVIGALSSRGVDGFILATMRRKRDSSLDQISDRPLVSVARRPDNERISSVVHDEEEGIRNLLDHLISLGHRKIAMIAGPQAISTGFGRFRAFERHLGKAGLNAAVPGALFADAFTEIEGQRCAQELLATKKAFTAVVCANDRLAIGAISAFRQHGLSCPEDVSVTGFNDMPFANQVQPPLTTVRLQHYEAGIRAANLIVGMIENDGSKIPPVHVVLPVEMIVRDSTQRVRA